LLSDIQTVESLLVTAGNVSIIGTTWNNFLDYVSGAGTVVQTGGGMIGAVIFTFCNFLFSLAGSKIVAVFSILIGLIFITDISVGDLFSKLFS
ncbi:cell division protein FtsK, partial [Staphylococcus sp. SIMBA_130]